MKETPIWDRILETLYKCEWLETVHPNQEKKFLHCIHVPEPLWCEFLLHFFTEGQPRTVTNSNPMHAVFLRKTNVQRKLQIGRKIELRNRFPNPWPTHGEALHGCSSPGWRMLRRKRTTPKRSRSSSGWQRRGWRAGKHRCMWRRRRRAPECRRMREWCCGTWRRAPTTWGSIPAARSRRREGRHFAGIRRRPTLATRPGPWGGRWRSRSSQRWDQGESTPACSNPCTTGRGQ